MPKHLKLIAIPFMNGTNTIFDKYAHLRTTDITDVKLLKQLFEELLEMDVSTKEGLEAFLEKRDQLSMHFVTESCESYFLMSTDVSNEQRKQRHEHLDKEITPLFRIYDPKLNRKFLEAEAGKALPPPFDVLRRNWSAEVELFCPENVDLLKKVDLIGLEITEILGKQTASWKGEEQPIPVVAAEYKNADREIRREAFEAVQEANGRIVDTLDEKFGKLLGLRQKIGENAGFENYIGYRFKEFRRFDWGPDDCSAFHQAVRKHILPLHRALIERRKTGLKLDPLRPYDGACDPLGREPLYIYEKGNSSELIEGTSNIIGAIDPELLGYFKRMRDNGLYDLETRPNKAPGGYMCMYPLYEQASVFWNGTGLADDLMVFLHELGHCFHYFLGKETRPYALQDWTCEVAEVGSMAMEFFGMEEMHHYLPTNQVQRIKEQRLHAVVRLLLGTAMGDDFQHWIYTHPDHSVAERRQKWLELGKIYNPGFERGSYREAIGKSGWQFPHILQMPFYLIDYAISEILALTLWDRYKADPADAIHHYKQGCSLSGSRPVPEIYETFGAPFSFGEAVIAPLAHRIAIELDLTIRD